MRNNNIDRSNKISNWSHTCNNSAFNDNSSVEPSTSREFIEKPRCMTHGDTRTVRLGPGIVGIAIGIRLLVELLVRYRKATTTRKTLTDGSEHLYRTDVPKHGAGMVQTEIIDGPEYSYCPDVPEQCRASTEKRTRTVGSEYIYHWQITQQPEFRKEEKPPVTSDRSWSHRRRRRRRMPSTAEEGNCRARRQGYSIK